MTNILPLPALVLELVHEPIKCQFHVANEEDDGDESGSSVRHGSRNHQQLHHNYNYNHHTVMAVADRVLHLWQRVH